MSNEINYKEEYYKLMELVKEAHKILGVGNLDHVDSGFFSGYETIMNASKMLRNALDHHQKLFPPKQNIPHE